MNTTVTKAYANDHYTYDFCHLSGAIFDKDCVDNIPEDDDLIIDPRLDVILASTQSTYDGGNKPDYKKETWLYCWSSWTQTYCRRTNNNGYGRGCRNKANIDATHGNEFWFSLYVDCRETSSGTWTINKEIGWWWNWCYCRSFWTPYNNSDESAAYA